MPIRTVADRSDFAVVQPRQEKQDDHGTTHHHHTPELSVDAEHNQAHQHCTDGHHALEQAVETTLHDSQNSGKGHAPVPYTHLTLPTNREVEISVVDIIINEHNDNEMRNILILKCT